MLELGCGTGRITRRGYRVTAVDESAEMRLVRRLDARWFVVGAGA